MSALGALLASSRGASSEGNSTFDGANESLPSEADSFDSSRARGSRPTGQSGPSSARLSVAAAGRPGWRAGAGAEGWDAKDPPGTAKKPQPRTRISRSASPSTAEATPAPASSRRAPTSSFAAAPTPTSSRPSNHLRGASSSSSNILSDFGGDDDDLFSQSPMGSPVKKSHLSSELTLNSGPAKTRDFSNGSSALTSSTATTAKVQGSYRSGRSTVASGEIAARSSMTLREQEKALLARDQEILDLKFRLHFFQQRLADTSSEAHQLLLGELVDVRTAYGKLIVESKKNKKLAVESQKVIEELKREIALLRRDGEANGKRRGLEGELTIKAREDAEARARAEDQLARERARADELDRELQDARSRREDEHDDRATEVDALRAKIAELEGENNDLGAHIDKIEDDLAANREEQPSSDRVVELEERIRELTEEGDKQREDLSQYEREHEQICDERDELERLLAEAQNGAPDPEEAEDAINRLRDKLNASELELERKIAELEDKEHQLEEAYQELDLLTEKTNEELEEAGKKHDLLEENITERDTIIDELQVQLQEQTAATEDAARQVTETQAEMQHLSEKFNEHLDECGAEKDTLLQQEQEIMDANEKLQEMSDRIQELEDEVASGIEIEKELRAKMDEDDAEFNDVIATNEEVVRVLQEKHASLKTDLLELTEHYNAAQDDLKVQRKQVTDLSELITELETRAKRIGIERDDLAGKLKREQNAHIEDAEHWKRLLADKDAALARLNADLDDARSRLATRDRDLDSLQEGVRQQGENHTNDRFALELEVQRVKRDLTRAEEDLERLRDDIAHRDLALGEREDHLAELRATGRKVEDQLASERQARLNVTDKLDLVQKTLKTTEGEAVTLRSRVEDLETRLSDDQRALMMSRNQSESQRKDSSELLLTVFQNVNKILGAEDRTTPANFSVFREALLARIGSLGKLQVDFEKKVKLCEQSFTEKLKAINRQLDIKWKHLDQFEANVRKVELVKTTWKNKFAQKQGELEALNAKHAELASQLTSLRVAARTDSPSELKALTARNNTLERRLVNAQNQLAAYEDKMESSKVKLTTAETKWDARVKEYERLLKEAQEKVKTERQGGKERAAQLEARVQQLEKNVEAANRRKSHVLSILHPEVPRAASTQVFSP